MATATAALAPITLLNIAGEIINLRGVEGNSGRATEKQFHKNFTNIDSEIEILKKVFGVPTLRHTPNILKKEGCSLTNEEAVVIKRILETRITSLLRGLKLSSGLAMNSTQQKIRNYQILLKRLKELTGVGVDDLPPCEPPTLKSIDIPKVQLPSFQRDTTVRELLLLVLMLLTGLAKGEIRRENIQERLGNTTLQEIANKLHTKQVTPKNVKGYLTTSLNLPSSFSGLLTEHGVITQNLSSCTAERERLTAEIRGKDDAILQLRELLEKEQHKAVNLAGRVTTSSDSELITELDSVKALKDELEMRIKGLEGERVAANDKLQALEKRYVELQQVSQQLAQRFEETKAKARENYDAKVLELEAAVRQKEEIQGQQEEKAVLQQEIIQLKEQITTLKKQEEEMISNVLIALNELKQSNSNINESSNVSQESVKARLGVLSAILEKHPDRDDIKQMVSRLQAAAAAEGTTDNLTDVTSISTDDSIQFAEELKKLLLQTALLDSDDETAILPDQIIEPVKEKLCLLLVFVELFYKQLKTHIGNSILEYKRTHTNAPSDKLRNLESTQKIADSIDRLLLGNIEDKDLWKNIVIIGQIIDGLVNTGLLPDVPDMYSKILALDERAGRLASLLKVIIKFLPNSNKIIKKIGDEYKIVDKFVNDTSFSELPILFLLQMKLLTRYTDYIINKAPNKLECPILGLAIGQS